MTLDYLPDIEAVLKILLIKFITFAANDSKYSGSARDFILNWIHPMFLKSKADTGK